jgi:GTP-binding protein
MAGMSDAVEVRGRGELQLAVLIENMRREGFELSVSPPVVIFKRSPLTGETLEPYEHVVVDVDETFSGMVIERMAQRKGNLKDFAPIGGKESGKSRLTFTAPSRGLIGFQSELKTESRGTATIHRTFDSYGEYIKGMERKPRAVLVSAASGQITAYALDTLQQRGLLFVKPGDMAYGGMILGECSRDSLFDMEVNPTKGKKLTNVRASGTDDAIRLSPPKVFSLEEAIVYVAPDELVEVTPSIIRLRKRLLDPAEREKLVRSYAKQMRKD